MSAYLQAADAIQHKFECVVIIIHHCGYDQTRPRGHSSQIGAADVQISIKKGDLVKGFIPKKGMVFVWGPPKCGKSFWVFTLMMHVALGREYRGHKVTQTPVVYLALEGQDGYGRRREAFRKRHMKPDEKIVGFKFCGVPLDLIKEHQLLIADIEEQGVRPGASYKGRGLLPAPRASRHALLGKGSEDGLRRRRAKGDYDSDNFVCS
jgi:hypothetical protein